MFKFLHAADIHLDSPLRGLERYEGAPVEQIRQATRRALENLIQLALDEKVSFVLLAGDLYDGVWKDYNTGLYLISQMKRLREAQIPVFAIAGNHDAANRMTRSLRLPDNVSVLSTEQPESRILEDLGVAIHGQGFATGAVREDLSERYPHAKRGYFNIGLLHTCATCTEGHERYAPCTTDGLRSKGYDYWALGHVHQRQTLADAPPIVFPGNLQGRHIREAGAKGCMLVTVQNGRRVEAEFHCLDVLRWERCLVNADGLEHADAVLEQTTDQLTRLRRDNDDRLLALRVEVHGSTPAHEQLLADTPRWTNEIRAQAIAVGGERLWIEKVHFHTRAAHPSGATAGEGPMEELLTVLEQLRTDAGQLQELAGQLDDLKGKLPPELRQGPDAPDLGDAAWLGRVLDRVRPILVRRLLSRETSR
jgi:DNA repair exonuclease SbcCD nuclease subunit